MRTLVGLGFFAFASIAACSSFSEADVTPGDDAGLAEAAAPREDASAPPLMDVTSPPPCEPDESDAGAVTFEPQARDAVLDPAAESTNDSATCDLARQTCLVAFDLGANAKRRIYSAELTLRRAIGLICNDDGATDPVDCELRQQNGIVVVRHMRSDWTATTSHGSPLWSAAGADGAGDVAPSAAQNTALINRSTTVTVPRENFDPRFLPGAASPTLAFRLTPDSGFHFVIHRIKNAGAASDLASLKVTFCR